MRTLERWRVRQGLLAGDGRPVTVNSSKADPMVQASPFECWAVQFLRMSAHLRCLMCASRARWPLEIVQVAVWRKNYQFW